MKSQDLTNKKTMAMTKTKTMIMTRLMTKAILETCDLWDIDCMTIENLNSWQSLWSDNLHCTAFTIFAMFFTNDMNTINFIIIIIWSRCLQLFLIHGTAGSATLRSPRGFKSLCTRTTSSLWLPMHILRPQCMRRRAEPKVYLCATETRYCCPLDSQPDYEISTFSLIAIISIWRWTKLSLFSCSGVFVAWSGQLRCVKVRSAGKEPPGRRVHHLPDGSQTPSHRLHFATFLYRDWQPPAPLIWTC